MQRRRLDVNVEPHLLCYPCGHRMGFQKAPCLFRLCLGQFDILHRRSSNTFNLVITTMTGEIEFGMLDQADYSGINEYVQKHGLQDASMAAARRAKKLNVNPPTKKGANGTNGAAPEEDDG